MLCFYISKFKKRLQQNTLPTSSWLGQLYRTIETHRLYNNTGITVYNLKLCPVTTQSWTYICNPKQENADYLKPLVATMSHFKHLRIWKYLIKNMFLIMCKYFFRKIFVHNIFYIKIREKITTWTMLKYDIQTIFPWINNNVRST